MKKYPLVLFVLFLSSRVFSQTLSLSDAVSIALKNNLDIEVLKNNVQIADINNHISIAGEAYRHCDHQ